MVGTPVRRIPHEALASSDLVVDAVYVGRHVPSSAADPLNELLSVSNQGGFRYRGSVESPEMIVVTSSFADPDWPDHLDRETGILTYFGDNKRPGRSLHDTPRFGNVLLRDMYHAIHSRPPRRRQVPPIFVFGKAGRFRDMKFLGLAVPGADQVPPMEDLVGVWKVTRGERFQNYKAVLTILNVACVRRSWIADILDGKPHSSQAPGCWQEWVQAGTYRPLVADRSVEYRTKDEQLPQEARDKSALSTIKEYFEPFPTQFEECAAKLMQLMDRNFVKLDITRPVRDGGRDAIGEYRVGRGASAIRVSFALEAKCYALANGVGVREVSRLISRLRHRQFGVLVTTSYLNTQAYREVKDDGHPIVVVSGRDIVEILASSGYRGSGPVQDWLRREFPRPEQQA